MKAAASGRRRRGVELGGILIFYLLSITYAEEYGQLLNEDGRASVWWAQAAYKIMKDDPAPQNRAAAIRISCAGNEYEPFILVIRPKETMPRISVKVGPLVGSDGRPLPGATTSICHVGYVKVAVPTDESGRAGEWPDPLPPYEEPFDAPANENRALWITVFVPAGASGGEYRSSLILSSGTWQTEFPVIVKVYDFSLPRETHIRSSFGLPTADIRRYHNLETQEELERVTDLYYQNFRNHRLAPTSPLELYPMKVSVQGLPWRGGEFVREPVHSGQHALKVEDASVSAAAEASSAAHIPVEPGKAYRLSWHAKTTSPQQPYTVLIQAYDAKGDYLPPRNELRVCEGGVEWRREALEIHAFLPDVREVSFHFFPAFRDESGSSTGTAYFDDVAFEKNSGGPNILPAGDMEVDIEALSVAVDFGDFDRGARRYLDAFGFNAFNLGLEGLGSGSFYSQREGFLAGFRQGTPEYERLLSQYLGLVESHLKENGWLGKEYIYWFDEPDPDDYPFVRQGMTNIRRAAPRLTRFITEHKPGPDIMDVSEISCTIFHRVDPGVVRELSRKGREFWSYLCTAPKAPWVTLFIDHPAVNLRLWLWMSYQYKLKGILVWRANYWTSPTVFPEEMTQNPWEDPMSYTVGYGTPLGQVNYWGNGDGRFLYPPNRDPNRDKSKYLCGPVNSIRWEILREGVEDYEYFWLLEKAVREAPAGKKNLAEKGRALLRVPDKIFKSGQDYAKDPRALLEYRNRLADLLERLL